MDNLDIKNLQLTYQAIYDQTLCESMEELGIIGEDRSGYGDDSKFNKPDDKIEKPGTTVPKPKKGGYGRISRSTPYGIGAHANRTQSMVTRTVGEDEGAPKAVKMATDKKTPKRVIPSRAKTTEEKPKAKKVIPSRFDKADFELWVDSLINEGYDLSDYSWEEMYEIYLNEDSDYYYEMLMTYLLDEGYANDVDSAEAIMINMSEEWVSDVVEGYKKLPIAKMIKQAKRLGQSNTPTSLYQVSKMARVADRHSIIKGKGKARAKGQAELNKRRGEARRNSQD
jgi:hypothetical protein